MKRAIAAILCAVVLFGLLPHQARARTFSLADTVTQDAHDSYYRSRQTAGRISFHGRCGLMVSHQLYNLGINKRCIVFDGNDQYDHYASQEKTSGGYYITPYPSEGYSLEEALLAVSQNGTRDVTNILVGFQWTNTEAGAKYGHAMLINGIVGGKVYFVESFDCSLGGAEGTVISCTIKQFAKYYDRWTSFEGLIHFGMGSYHDVCPRVNTELVVQTRFPTILRSEPAIVGRQGCVRLRSIAAGERLHVTAIYEAERAYYYRVQTNDGFGFIPAGSASLLQVNSDGLSLTGFALSRQMTPGTVPVFGGTVTDATGTLTSVEVCITDPQGQLLRRELLEVEDGVAELKALRYELLFDLLESGSYQVDIYAGRSCPAVSGSYTDDYYTRVQLASRSLYVGSNHREGIQLTHLQSPHRDGWVRENGTWYCYQGGQPCTGWVEHLGVRYYLQSDGSVTTGAQTIDEKQLYFSVAGALVTGWLTLENNTTYRTSDGTALTGWQELEGKLYCFDENGIMLTKTEAERDGILYTIAPDGTATQKQEAQNG